MPLPGLVMLGPDQAWNVIRREVGTGRKIYICRWGEGWGLGVEGFDEERGGIFGELRKLFSCRGSPVILVTEQTVYQLTSSKPRSLFWWRWQLGLLHKVGKGLYGFEKAPR